MAMSENQTVPAPWYPPPDGSGPIDWYGLAWQETWMSEAAGAEVTPAKKIRKGRNIALSIIGGVFALIMLSGCGSPKPAAQSHPKATTATHASPSSTPTPAAPTVAKQSFSGTGDNVETVNIAGPAIAQFSCPGCTDNTVVQANGGTDPLLVNVIGAYTGTTLIDAENGSVVTQVTVTASSAWTLTIDDITAARTVQGVASGHGDDVFLLTSTSTKATITNNGSSNFAVYGYSEAISNPLLVNEIGAYNGTVPLIGPAVVQVQSDGDWTITPQ